MLADDPTDDAADPRTLLGQWRLQRYVEDRLGPARTVVGTLSLEADGTDRIRWREVGTMSWVDGETEVSRELTLVREPDGAGWTVHFADGRVFHPWRPGRQVHHPCGSDDYRGLVEVDPRDVHGAPTGWSVRWDVTGPAKDYTMTTRLSRIARIGT